MGGSYIIQDGKIVGVEAYVPVNETTRRYLIFTGTCGCSGIKCCRCPTEFYENVKKWREIPQVLEAPPTIISCIADNFVKSDLTMNLSFDERYIIILQYFTYSMDY